MKNPGKWILILALALAGGARAGVDVAATATGSIEGKVVIAATGEALAGVRLRLQGTNDAREPVLKDTREAVVSGVDGAFRLTGVPAGRAVITAIFPGEPVADWVAEDVPVTVKAAETRRDVLVRALKGGVAVVRVVSWGDSKPRADAPVTFSNWLSEFPIVAKTGADGLARVRLLPDTWQACAREAGPPYYYMQTDVMVVTSQTNQVEVSVAPKITGIIQNPNGTPAQGVVVTVNGLDIISSAVTTDSNGRYALSWWDTTPMDVMVVGSTTYVYARSADWKWVAIGDIDVHATEKDLTLQPSVTLSTRVEDPAGHPITNAFVSGGVRKGLYSYHAGTNSYSKTDAQGHVEFPGLPQGDSYYVFGQAKNYMYSGQDIRMPDPPTNRINGPTIVLQSVGTNQLSGKILDADGNPVPKVGLEATGISYKVQPVAGKVDAWDVETMRGWEFGFTQTDSHGLFFFDPVCDGPIELTILIQAPPTILQTTGGTTNIILRLDNFHNNDVRGQPADQGIKISGTVRDPSGALAVGVMIGWADYYNQDVRTGLDGRYTITWPMEAQSLVLFARDEEHNLSASHMIDGKITNVDLSLQRGLTLSMKAQDTDGRPIPSATETVALKEEGGDWILSQIPARADEEGSLEVTALPQGWPYVATVTARGFNTITASVPAQTTLTNRLELPPAMLRVEESSVAGQSPASVTNDPATSSPRSP